MTKYLINAANLDDLKKLYKKMAMKLHPDMGGSTEEMQALNAEYEARFEVLKRSQNEQAAADTTGRTHATTEAPNDFINIISALLHMEGLSVELTGRWLWITGRTLEHKEDLKASGCRWCSSKKCWSWHHAEDGSKFYRGHRSMDAIRAKYGSEVFASHGAERQTIAG
jgi:curved DNA-binding protein CbpA